MSDFLKSLSSYNLFNNLLPGVVFSVLVNKIFFIPLVQTDIVTGVFFYYFVGLVISRIGSVIVEPTLKFLGLLSFSDYADFVTASKEDSKIETLSETNNMYRTMLSMMLLIGLLGIYSLLKTRLLEFDQYSIYLVISALIILFASAYKKQTEYIKKRIVKIIKEKSKIII